MEELLALRRNEEPPEPPAFQDTARVPEPTVKLGGFIAHMSARVHQSPWPGKLCVGTSGRAGTPRYSQLATAAIQHKSTVYYLLDSYSLLVRKTLP